MADSTSNIPGIVPNSQSKEQQANALFDAASQAMTYGRNAATSSGLTWGFLGGNVVVADGSRVRVENGTLTLTASSTCYIVAAKADGAVSFATTATNWDNDSDYWRLYSVVTGTATVTSWVDHRCPGQYQGAGSGGGMTNPMTTAGDIIVGGASGAPERLAKGTAGHALFAGASAPEYRVIEAADITDASAAGKALLTAADEAAQRTALSVREQLTANRTYYVRTDGSDSNDGLANNSGGAFLTLQKAWDAVASLDLGIYAVTIQVADDGGTPYAAGIDFNKSPIGGSRVTIQGNTTTPADCELAVNTGAGGAAFYVTVPLSCGITITGFRITNAAGSGIRLDAPAKIVTGNNIYGPVTLQHLRSGAPGAYIETNGDYSIDGGATSHFYSSSTGFLRSTGGTITISGTPAFSQGFARADGNAYSLIASKTFTGSATGARYAVLAGGGINTDGAGATFFPGDSAGTDDGKGFYL